MKDKRTFKLQHPQARANAVEAVRAAPEGYVVVVSEASRNLDQNAAQWPILQAFADQLQWPVNGSMVWMSAEEWKDVLSAAFKRETVRVAMGLDGGMVMLGSRTSEFGKKQFSDWLEFLHATAAAREVDLRYREEA
ncbi:recombination protein NinB [Variovorax sp. J22R193]|uniref:recombination protein NinB n=1 Tax=Variovorax fucosicus TaxID=3053517 RepID=UPI0025768081|nr:recombination protein NinB [Variovorax sp. J22R193]MDM0041861.1 recombination protein NinB [Variovorax sp. J22R193]